MQETAFFALTGAWLCGALTLLHGAVWRAHRERWSTRVGLEDGCLRLDGERAAGNADMVSDAVRLFRSAVPG